METADEISYEDLFSTDIDVIRRIIDLGKYKDIDAKLISDINEKTKSFTNDSRSFDIMTDYVNMELSLEEVCDIAKYFNIYTNERDIEKNINNALSGGFNASVNMMGGNICINNSTVFEDIDTDLDSKIRDWITHIYLVHFYHIRA